MASYDYVVVKNLKGEGISASVGFEHAKNELRCLACMHDEGVYEWAVINAGKLTLTEAESKTYFIAYPFSVAGKPWSVYIWRATRDNATVEYNGSRIPIEGIIAKLEELSAKCEENAKENGRALRTPEGDMDMFVPPEDVRAGKILGFDEDGKPAVGEHVKQVQELFEIQITCENYAEAAAASAAGAATSESMAKHYEERAAEYAEDSAESAEKSEDYYNKSISTYEKIGSAVANGVSDIEKAATEATEHIEATVGEAVETAEHYAEDAQASATSAAESESLAQVSADKAAAALETAVKGWSTKIVASLPSSPSKNTVYFVGSDSTGYEMKIYSDGQWVSIGSTNFAENKPMTETAYGLGKLSTGDTLNLNTAGAVGTNEAGQLLVKRASKTNLGAVKLSTSDTFDLWGDDYTKRGGEVGLAPNGEIFVVSGTLDRFGAVRLGSKYQPTHSAPYVVGIAASSNAGKVGQLAFNLRQTQSDGSPGVLKHVFVSVDGGTNNATEMYVEEASESQMGVVKLLTSMADYTDDELSAIRNTHAASVGLVVDGLGAYAKEYLNETRIGEFFDNWATGKDLAAQIWGNEEYKTSLETYLSDYVVNSSVLTTTIESTSKTWLANTITEDYINSLFKDKVLAVCEAAVEENWTNKLEDAIYEAAEASAEKHTESRVLAYLSNPDNLEVLAGVIKDASISEILESSKEAAEAGAIEYVEGVFNGQTKIVLDDENVFFSDYVSKKSEAAVESLTTVVDARVSALERKLTAITTGTNATWKKVSSKTLGCNERADIDVNDVDVIVFHQNTPYTDDWVVWKSWFTIKTSWSHTAPAYLDKGNLGAFQVLTITYDEAKDKANVGVGTCRQFNAYWGMTVTCYKLEG